MYIDTRGSGADLVLIHGWAMHGGIFAPLLPWLEAHFRLHLVDLPGHGRSAASAEPVEPRACAALIASRVPAAAIWAGWSFGGLVSLQAALTLPAPPRGIVQIAASPCFVANADWPHGVAADVFVQFGDGLRRDYRGTIERFIALETLGSAHAHAELRELKAHVFERGEPAPAALQQGLHALQTSDLRANLPGLRVPSLWIAGRRDRLVPAGALRWAAQNSRDADCVEFASGHAPFLGHAPELAAAIAAFAARLPAP
jgi:pimeloyl-[acyl-carrier protein] methyl ester esterase